MQGLIARVISSVLGSWIQLQPDQLQVGLWSGNASFQSLEFNVDKLNGILHEHEELCNVRVMSAAIGKLEMKIPWRAMLLGDAPIEITIEKVAILLNRVDSNINKFKQSAKSTKIKMFSALLEQLVNLRKSEISTKDDIEFSRDILIRVLDNLTFRLENLTFEFHDDQIPHSLILCIPLVLVSTPVISDFTNLDSNYFRKQLQIKNAAVYYKNGRREFDFVSTDDFLESMYSFSEADLTLVSPVSITCEIDLSRNSKHTMYDLYRASKIFSISCSSLSLNIPSQSIPSLARSFKSLSKKHEDYFPRSNKILWVFSFIRHKALTSKWSTIFEFRHDFKEYISLKRECIYIGNFNNSRLAYIESRWSVDQICLFESISKWHICLEISLEHVCSHSRLSSSTSILKAGSIFVNYLFKSKRKSTTLAELLSMKHKLNSDDKYELKLHMAKFGFSEIPDDPKLIETQVSTFNSQAMASLFEEDTTDLVVLTNRSRVQYQLFVKFESLTVTMLLHGFDNYLMFSLIDMSFSLKHQLLSTTVNFKLKTVYISDITKSSVIQNTLDESILTGSLVYNYNYISNTSIENLASRHIDVIVTPIAFVISLKFLESLYISFKVFSFGFGTFEDLDSKKVEKSVRKRFYASPDSLVTSNKKSRNRALTYSADSLTKTSGSICFKAQSIEFIILVNSNEEISECDKICLIFSLSMVTDKYFDLSWSKHNFYKSFHPSTYDCSDSSEYLESDYYCSVLSLSDARIKMNNEDIINPFNIIVGVYQPYFSNCLLPNLVDISVSRVNCKFSLKHLNNLYKLANSLSSIASNLSSLNIFRDSNGYEFVEDTKDAEFDSDDDVNSFYSAQSYLEARLNCDMTPEFENQSSAIIDSYQKIRLCFHLSAVTLEVFVEGASVSSDEDFLIFDISMHSLTMRHHSSPIQSVSEVSMISFMVENKSKNLKDVDSIIFTLGSEIKSETFDGFFDDEICAFRCFFHCWKNQELVLLNFIPEDLNFSLDIVKKFSPEIPVMYDLSSINDTLLLLNYGASLNEMFYRLLMTNATYCLINLGKIKVNLSPANFKTFFHLFRLYSGDRIKTDDSPNYSNKFLKNSSELKVSFNSSSFSVQAVVKSVEIDLYNYGELLDSQTLLVARFVLSQSALSWVNNAQSYLDVKFSDLKIQASNSKILTGNLQVYAIWNDLERITLLQVPQLRISLTRWFIIQLFYLLKSFKSDILKSNYKSKSTTKSSGLQKMENVTFCVNQFHFDVEMQSLLEHAVIVQPGTVCTSLASLNNAESNFSTWLSFGVNNFKLETFSSQSISLSGKDKMEVVVPVFTCVVSGIDYFIDIISHRSELKVHQFLFTGMFRFDIPVPNHEILFDMFCNTKLSVRVKSFIVNLNLLSLNDWIKITNGDYFAEYSNFKIELDDNQYVLDIEPGDSDQHTNESLLSFFYENFQWINRTTLSGCNCCVSVFFIMVDEIVVKLLPANYETYILSTLNDVLVSFSTSTSVSFNSCFSFTIQMRYLSVECVSHALESSGIETAYSCILSINSDTNHRDFSHDYAEQFSRSFIWHHILPEISLNGLYICFDQTSSFVDSARKYSEMNVVFMRSENVFQNLKIRVPEIKLVLFPTVLNNFIKIADVFISLVPDYGIKQEKNSKPSSLFIYEISSRLTISIKCDAALSCWLCAKIDDVVSSIFYKSVIKFDFKIERLFGGKEIATIIEKPKVILTPIDNGKYNSKLCGVFEPELYLHFISPSNFESTTPVIFNSRINFNSESPNDLEVYADNFDMCFSYEDVILLHKILLAFVNCFNSKGGSTFSERFLLFSNSYVKFVLKIPILILYSLNGSPLFMFKSKCLCLESNKDILQLNLEDYQMDCFSKLNENFEPLLEPNSTKAIYTKSSSNLTVDCGNINISFSDEYVPSLVRAFNHSNSNLFEFVNFSGYKMRFYSLDNLMNGSQVFYIENGSKLSIPVQYFVEMGDHRKDLSSKIFGKYVTVPRFEILSGSCWVKLDGNIDFYEKNNHRFVILDVPCKLSLCVSTIDSTVTFKSTRVISNNTSLPIHFRIRFLSSSRQHFQNNANKLNRFPEDTFGLNNDFIINSVVEPFSLYYLPAFVEFDHRHQLDIFHDNVWTQIGTFSRLFNASSPQYVKCNNLDNSETAHWYTIMVDNKLIDGFVDYESILHIFPIMVIENKLPCDIWVALEATEFSFPGDPGAFSFLGNSLLRPNNIFAHFHVPTMLHRIESCSKLYLYQFSPFAFVSASFRPAQFEWPGSSVCIQLPRCPPYLNPVKGHYFCTCGLKFPNDLELKNLVLDYTLKPFVIDLSYSSLIKSSSDVDIVPVSIILYVKFWICNRTNLDIIFADEQYGIASGQILSKTSSENRLSRFNAIASNLFDSNIGKLSYGFTTLAPDESVSSNWFDNFLPSNVDAFMFAPPNISLYSKIFIKIKDFDKWSASISLENNSEVSIPLAECNQLGFNFMAQLCFSLSPCDMFHQTTVVKIHPKYFFLNSLDVSIVIAPIYVSNSKLKRDFNSTLYLSPNEIVPALKDYHVDNTMNLFCINVPFEESKCLCKKRIWSSFFDISKISLSSPINQILRVKTYFSPSIACSIHRGMDAGVEESLLVRIESSFFEKSVVILFSEVVVCPSLSLGHFSHVVSKELYLEKRKYNIAPYRIENKSPFLVRFRQDVDSEYPFHYTGNSTDFSLIDLNPVIEDVYWDFILPASMKHYSWDFPFVKPKNMRLCLELTHVFNSQSDLVHQGIYSFDVMEEEMIELSKPMDNGVSISIFADGPVKVMRICEKVLSRSLSERSIDSFQMIPKTYNLENEYSLNINVSTLTVSIIDHFQFKPFELLFLSLSNICSSTHFDNEKVCLSVALQSIQVDNQMIHYSTQCPVLFNTVNNITSELDEKIYDENMATYVMSRTTSERKEPSIFLEVTYSRFFSNDFLLALIKFDLGFVPLEIHLEDEILLIVYNYFNKISAIASSRKPAVRNLYASNTGTTACGIDDFTLRTVINKSLVSQRILNRILFIESFSVDSFPITMSYTAQDRNITNIDSSQNDIELMSLMSYMGPVMLSINSAPLIFGKYNRKRISSTTSNLVSDLGDHYILEATLQVYKIIGSLGIIGDPNGILNTISKKFGGNYDSVISSLHVFLRTVLLNSSSVIYQLSNSTALWLSSFTRYVPTLDDIRLDQTIDDENSREHKRRDIIQGIFDGVLCYATAPTSGLQENGLLGGFQGVFTGISGLILYPLSGFVGFLASSSDRINSYMNEGLILKQKPRLRPPRNFSYGRLIIPFDISSAPLLTVLEGYFSSELRKLVIMCKNSSIIHKIYPNSVESYFAHIASCFSNLYFVFTDKNLLILKISGFVNCNDWRSCVLHCIKLEHLVRFEIICTVYNSFRVVFSSKVPYYNSDNLPPISTFMMHFCSSNPIATLKKMTTYLNRTLVVPTALVYVAK